MWTATKSDIAKEALDSIGKLYDIERAIDGGLPDIRLAVRQQKSKPKVEAFWNWAEQELPRIPGKSDLARLVKELSSFRIIRSEISLISLRLLALKMTLV